MSETSPIMCPLCSKPLSLKQINIKTAVYLCDDSTCKYPMGFQWIQVERTLEDLTKTAKVDTKENDINEWMDDILDLQSENQPTLPSEADGASKSTTNDQFDYNADYNELLKFLDS